MNRKAKGRDTLFTKLKGLTLRRGKSRFINSELQPSMFACTSEPAQKKRKRSILHNVRERFQQKRRLKKENFTSPVEVKSVRKKLICCAAAATALALFFALNGPVRVGYMLNDVSLFKIRSFSVEGVASTSSKTVRQLSGITLYKTSLLELDIKEIEKKIEQEPWVSKATVKRDWPSDVVIMVREHEPVALMNMSVDDGPELFYVDRKGNAFLQVRPGNDVDFPVITGLDTIPDKALREQIFGEMMAFLKRARRNNPNLPVQSISEMHINRHGNMVVYLVDYPFPIFFGQGETVTKFHRLRRVLESMYKDKKSDTLLSGVEYIRMDYLQDKVLVAQSESG